jgi:hypothetical protein
MTEQAQLMEAVRFSFSRAGLLVMEFIVLRKFVVGVEERCVGENYHLLQSLQQKF